jgi:hypothetical protein
VTTTSVVRPLPGQGLVARSGDLMLVCADSGDEVEQLLGLVTEVANAGGDGSMLVRRVAGLLAADLDGKFPACAACGPVADGRLAVVVYGSATARVLGADGEISLSAADAVTAVNRLVSGPITAVRLELPGAGPASRFARIDGGVVSAAGVVSGEGLDGAAATPVWPTPVAPAQSAATESAPAWTAPAAPAESAPSWSATPAWPSVAESVPTPSIPVSMEPVVSAVADAPSLPSWAGPSVVDASVVPMPFTMDPPEPPPALTAPSDGFTLVAPRPAAEASVTEAPETSLPQREPLATDSIPAVVRATVLGLLCPQGHLNDPSTSACATCGEALGTQPSSLREGPRPPLGVLTLDDGTVFVLDTGYVLGREPQHDSEVVSGYARPLRVADAEGVVSRRHLRVALVGWDIQVVDLGSANGTYVQYPGDPQLHRLEAQRPVVVKHGTQVTMGRRWFRIDPVPADAA